MENRRVYVKTLKYRGFVFIPLRSSSSSTVVDRRRGINGNAVRKRATKNKNTVLPPLFRCVDPYISLESAVRPVHAYFEFGIVVKR